MLPLYGEPASAVRTTDRILTAAAFSEPSRIKIVLPPVVTLSVVAERRLGQDTRESRFRLLVAFALRVVLLEEMTTDRIGLNGQTARVTRVERMQL